MSMIQDLLLFYLVQFSFIYLFYYIICQEHVQVDNTRIGKSQVFFIFIFFEARGHFFYFIIRGMPRVICIYFSGYVLKYLYLEDESGTHSILLFFSFFFYYVGTTSSLLCVCFSFLCLFLSQFEYFKKPTRSSTQP